MLKNVKKELDAVYSAREKALKVQREIVPLCSNAIKDLHQNRRASAIKKLQKIKRKIKQVEGILKRYPEIVNSVLGAAYQEYAELSIFLTYTSTGKLPKLNVPAKYYVLGLGDAIGELKRQGMELLADHKIEQAVKLEKHLEDLYFKFADFNYPQSVVPGLKHKQDVARKVLNDFHNQILAYKLTRP